MVYRNTRQRQLVLDTILECDDGVHLNADSIYRSAKQKEPKISLGTVYRNLDILCSMGIIVKIKYGNSAEYYDKNTSPHYHFYCERCGDIIDMDMPYSEDLDEALRVEGYSVRRHRLIFDGVCKDCQNTDNTKM